VTIGNVKDSLTYQYLSYEIVLHQYDIFDSQQGHRETSKNYFVSMISNPSLVQPYMTPRLNVFVIWISRDNVNNLLRNIIEYFLRTHY